jgi:hypothetical protein
MSLCKSRKKNSVMLLHLIFERPNLTMNRCNDLFFGKWESLPEQVQKQKISRQLFFLDEHLGPL